MVFKESGISSQNKSKKILALTLVDLTTKYKRCKLLVKRQVITINQLNKTIEQLKITNVNDLANHLEEQRHHQTVALKLNTMIKSNRIAAKANIDALNENHAAQVDALKHKCKRCTESKLNMLSQGCGYLCKNHVGTPTHIPSDTSSPESLNDVESSGYDRTTINLLLCIRDSPKIISKNLDLADTILNDARSGEGLPQLSSIWSSYEY